MANPPQNIQKQTFIEYGQVTSGPIPDPDIMARYKIADPTFPERIMKMAEAHNAADVKIKNRISFANMAIPIIGQVFTVILACGGTAACIYLAIKGFSGPAIASITASYAPIVINALRNLRGKK